MASPRAPTRRALTMGTMGPNAGGVLPLPKQVNAVLGDHLGASRDLTLDTVHRIENAVQRLEENLKQDYSGLRSDLDRVKDMVTGISSQVEVESQDLWSRLSEAVDAGFIIYVSINFVLMLGGLLLTVALSICYALSVIWWILLYVPKWLVSRLVLEALAVPSAAACHYQATWEETLGGSIAFGLVYIICFIRFRVLVGQVLKASSGHVAASIRDRWRLTYLARSCHLPFAIVAPFACLMLCRVSQMHGLPWYVHSIYLACLGLAVPSQLIPRDANGDAATELITGWKVPCCARSPPFWAHFYHFNVQLLWCMDQYLDCVNIALAIHVGYPYATSMALIFFLSLAFQLWSAHDWKVVLHGMAPSAIAPDEANRVMMVRLLTEHIPQIRIQVSLALWLHNRTQVVPVISVGIASCFALQELALLISLLLSQAATTTYMQPAAEELVESQALSEARRCKATALRRARTLKRVWGKPWLR
eukprot:Skav201587  [mRNA]  locus=scaffold152:458808:467370:+ [translate_table: standard]